MYRLNVKEMNIKVINKRGPITKKCAKEIHVGLLKKIIGLIRVIVLDSTKRVTNAHCIVSLQSNRQSLKKERRLS